MVEKKIEITFKFTDERDATDEIMEFYRQNILDHCAYCADKRYDIPVDFSVNIKK